MPSERLALLRRVHTDARYLGMKPRAKHVLTVAVEKFADGKGHFWPKVKTLAEEAGVSTGTVKRALAEAVEVGLISREPYLRPDGLQGSTSYFIDGALVWPENRQGGSDTSQRSAAKPGRRQGGSPLIQRQGRSAVIHQNGLGTEERLVGREKVCPNAEGPSNGWITPVANARAHEPKEPVSRWAALQAEKRAEFDAWRVAEVQRMLKDASGGPQ
jgi:hypothetical protein